MDLPREITRMVRRQRMHREILSSLGDPDSASPHVWHDGSAGDGMDRQHGAQTAPPVGWSSGRLQQAQHGASTTDVIASAIPRIISDPCGASVRSMAETKARSMGRAKALRYIEHWIGFDAIPRTSSGYWTENRACDRFRR